MVPADAADPGGTPTCRDAPAPARPGQVLPAVTGRRPQDVVQRVQDVIARGRLRPGDPLPTEVDLCEAVGASRSSVREAIRTLCALDLVEVRHGHGTSVGRMSMDPLVQSVAFRGRLDRSDGSGVRREVVEVRQRIDQAAGAALLALTDEAERARLLERLGALAQQMKDLAARGAPAGQEHRAFHLLLSEPLHNGLMSELAGAFGDIDAALAAPGHAASSRAALTHVAIVEAAASGDAGRVQAALAAHYAPRLEDPHRRVEPGR
jgi:DNA-binding FadR family transcriptional regulator